MSRPQRSHGGDGGRAGALDAIFGGQKIISLCACNILALGYSVAMKEKQLTKAEIEMLQHALYCYREQVRTQLKFALDEKSETAKRDCDRFQKIIGFALKLDDKLSDL